MEHFRRTDIPTVLLRSLLVEHFYQQPSSWILISIYLLMFIEAKDITFLITLK